MAVVQMPAGAVFTKRAWTPPAQNQVNKSGWTGARKVLRLPGAGVWKVTASVKPISREVDAWPWKAFLSVLEGQANTFLMPFACKQTAAANPVVVASAFQGATTNVLLGGMPPGLFLRGGRALTFLLPSGKRQLVLLTQDLVAGNDGEAYAAFRGALRETVAAGVAVEARDPVCEMAMMNADVPWDENEGVYTVAFDAEEAF